MTDLTPFLESNQHLLEQLKRQLAFLTDSHHTIYSDAFPIIGGASIGAHLRHILDFYSAYYLGSIKGHINYDERLRNTKVESELKSGLEEITHIIKLLKSQHCLSNKPVTVNTAVEITQTHPVGESNLIRELQSLHSHTTHHMAIIAIVLKLNMISVDDDFGKAPSTIQYERKNQLINHSLAPSQHE